MPRSLKVAGFIIIFIHIPMNKYGPKANKKIDRVMHEWKHGELKSGKSNKKVKSRKQAVAIAISEARQSGAKVPSRSKTKKTQTRKKK